MSTCGSLILIAGIGTPRIEEWAIVTNWWRGFLATTASSLRILTFDHSLVPNDDVKLEAFVETGDALLACLSKHMMQQEVSVALLIPRRHLQTARSHVLSSSCATV